MQANIKTTNKKQLKVKALVDSGFTYTGIDEQLVKDKRIQMKLINFSFKVYNADRTKNREVTRIAPLEIEINGHKEHFKAIVTDLNGTYMFLGHDWLVKHNQEVDWKDSMIKFTRYLGLCRIKHQDIKFKIQWTQAMETSDKDKSDIGKEPDPTNLEDLLDYIWPFMHLFNKKFERLLERREWDYEINLTDEAPKELNIKAYVIAIKEETLNQ